MAHRANLVVLRNGSWELYYDRHGAGLLAPYLFPGSEEALEYIEGNTDRSGWLDEVFCEGAALLDFDDRVLLFFDSGNVMDDIPLRRIHLALMSDNWPGWDIRWAHEGIVSIGDYLKLDRAQFLEPSGRLEGYYSTDDTYDLDETLLTMVERGSTVARKVYSGGGEYFLQRGPQAFDKVRAVPAATSLIWRGDFPQFGIHVDFDHSILRFWSAPPLVAQRIAEAWPGWKINWLRNDFETHIALSGLDIQLPHRSFAELLPYLDSEAGYYARRLLSRHEGAEQT